MTPNTFGRGPTMINLIAFKELNEIKKKMVKNLLLARCAAFAWDFGRH